MMNSYVTLSNSEKLGLISNFSTMLSAGISIIETVDSLLDDSKGGLKKILEIIKADLIQGNRLYISLGKFPNVFDKVTVNIIKASEEAGTLDITLKDLKDNIKKEIEFSDKIRSALIYPVLIIIVFIGVLLLILTFVIPKISEVFSRLKMQLPITTQILIFTSNFLLKYTVPIIIFFIIFLSGVIYFYRTRKRELINFFSSLPILSGMVREIDLARFSRSLSLLLNSGLPITMALDLSKDIVVKNEIRNTIIYAKDTVLSGRRLSEGFKEKRSMIPGIMIKIIEAGEKSGTLERSMQDISEYLDYTVSNSIKTVTAMIEPIILVVVGVFVGGMMLSILAPIYGLISQVSSR